MMNGEIELREKLTDLSGMQVTRVTAGGSTGSVFTLLMQRASVATNNTTAILSEYEVMVKCSWRLDNVEKVLPITGWQEDSNVDGVMTLRLKTLVDDVISKAEISSFFDLEIIFESGKRMFVFCDITPYVDGNFNWVLFTKEGHYSINTGLKCNYEKNKSFKLPN